MKVRSLTRMEKYLLAIIAVYSVVVTIANPAFLTFETLLDMVRAASGTLILASGVLVVLISGGIDVSFTAIAIIGGYVSVRLMLSTGINSLLFASAISCLIGLACGLINALIIHCFHLPTLIATLGTSSVFYGVMTTFMGTKGVNASQMPSSMVDFGGCQLFVIPAKSGTTYGLTVFIIPVVIILIVTWFILYRTMLGRGIFALGNSEEAANRAGFNLLNIRLFIYSFMGVVAGIMGIVYVSEVRWVNPIALVGTELSIIASVVIGGAKLSGGEGTIFGTILGVLIIKLLNSTLVFLGLSSSWNDFFIGIILIASVAVTSYQARLKNRRDLIFTE